MSDVNPLKQTRLWAFLGKLAVLITILWGLTQLYNYYFPPASSLEAVGTTGSVDIKGLPIYRRLVTEQENEKKNVGRSISLSNLANSKYNFLSITIKNTGKLEANDVVIKFPNNTLTTVTAIEINGQPAQAINSSEIRLGDIKPDISIEVFIWDQYTIITDPRNVVVAHRNGSTKLEMASRIHGKMLLLVNLLDPVFGLIILATLALLALVIYAAYIEEQKKKIAITQDKTS